VKKGKKERRGWRGEEGATGVRFKTLLLLFRRLGFKRGRRGGKRRRREVFRKKEGKRQSLVFLLKN